MGNKFLDKLKKPETYIPMCGKKVLGKNAGKRRVKGRIVIVRKEDLKENDVASDINDESSGRKVSLQLVSSNVGNPADDNRGNIGKEIYLDDWTNKVTMARTAGDVVFDIRFDYDVTMGLPGAFIIRNHHHTEFYVKSMTLRTTLEFDEVHFECNSWVYPANLYNYDRIFFSNRTYLPGNTPEPLRHYREQELMNLRGNGTGELREWDRVYDYAYYNDLGFSDIGTSYTHPILGGSDEYPYPRRGRTGKKPNDSDPNRECRLPGLNLNVYVPRDERFSHSKMSNFLNISLSSIGQIIQPETEFIFEETENEFNSYQELGQLYRDGLSFPNEVSVLRLSDCVPWEILKGHFRPGAERCLKLPVPAVIQANDSAWETDEEFAREMLAGVNPVVIRCLKEFPAVSKLDPEVYGNQDSCMIRAQVEGSMGGVNLETVLKNNKLFILDYHDAIMPYLNKINTSTSTKTYASRTLLLLQDDGTLKPLQIELSLPFSEGDAPGCASQVFAPAREGYDDFLWRLAKAYVAVNDSGYHQLISHWLNTHAVMEPFVIATNRQLSTLHPIYKLLHPHFRDTMHINALARQILINAGGIFEKTVFPDQYAMEMSSAIYKSWNFTEQALPADLLKRGMAVPDPDQPHGLRLLVADYPYAVDGLEIWSAIETWVLSYCTFYYPDDESVSSDTELQDWWNEIRTVGHGDLKDKPWWPTMQTQGDLIQTCTIIIWLASAQHAAVNFGQYAYAGYPLNRPTRSRMLIPEPGHPAYPAMRYNFAGVFLGIFTSRYHTMLGLSLIDVLARHLPDEMYLGRRETLEWTCDAGPLEEFGRFRHNLVQIERNITQRNNDKSFKNRFGPAQVPYTLLNPSTLGPSAIGHSGKGIPNSVSI